MGKKEKEFNPLVNYDPDDLKMVYRALHRQLSENVDLMDSKLLADLQQHLHSVALENGVDVTDHAALDAWLGNPAVACETRNERRQAQSAPPPTRERLN